MSAPAGAQVSEDGNYWWDGSAWQAITEFGGANAGSTDGANSADATNSGEAGQLSEDGQYQWDGTQWQQVTDGGQQDPAGGANDSQAGQAQGEQPVDWDQFPAIKTLLMSSSVDEYYQNLGIDPQKLEADASSGN